MKTLGKILGFILGFGVMSTGSILLFFVAFLLSIIIIATPLYFVWNHMSAVEGFKFIPHLSFWNVLILTILIRLLHLAWTGINIKQNIPKKKEPIATDKKGGFSY